MKASRRRNKKEAARAIRTIRRRLRLSQEGLAQRIGVSWSTVQAWEAAKRPPSPLADRQIEALLNEALDQ